MTTQLHILDQGELIDYVKSLDLKEGTEQFRSFNALLRLSGPTYTKAVSALAQGLIDLGDIRGLPAVSDRLIEGLIISSLSASDSLSLAYRYRNDWFPAAVDTEALKVDVLGDMTNYLRASLYDAATLVLSPTYDLYYVDTAKFNSYAEAFDAYMMAANSPAAVLKIQQFEATHASFKLQSGVTTVDEGPLSAIATVRALRRDAMFLNRSNFSMTALRSTPAAFLCSQIYRYVPPLHLIRFMDEIAYPKMVERAGADALRTGKDAADILAAQYSYAVPPLDQDFLWNFSQQRIAKVHLTRAYGRDTTNSGRAAASIVAYLDAASATILDVREIISRGLVKDSEATAAVSGSPVGLALLITNN